MTFFDFFRRKQPSQILMELRHIAVIASLTFRQQTKEGNDELSANAGAELLYFLLHVTDTVMYLGLKPTKRAEYFDLLTLDAIRSYANAILVAEAPDELQSGAREMMLRRFNSRQATYARCTSLAGEVLPTPGSKMFALSFLVHRALGRTERVTFDDILAGIEPIKESEFADFPGVESIVLWSTFAAGSVQDMKLSRAIRSLR